jgi:hypothetical protein
MEMLRTPEPFSFFPTRPVCTCAVIGALSLGNYAYCRVHNAVIHGDRSAATMLLEASTSDPPRPSPSYFAADARATVDGGMAAAASPMSRRTERPTP